jgi:hypothetical protein
LRCGSSASPRTASSTSVKRTTWPASSAVTDAAHRVVAPAAWAPAFSARRNAPPGAPGVVRSGRRRRRREGSGHGERAPLAQRAVGPSQAQSPARREPALPPGRCERSQAELRAHLTCVECVVNRHRRNPRHGARRRLRTVTDATTTTTANSRRARIRQCGMSRPRAPSPQRGGARISPPASSVTDDRDPRTTGEFRHRRCTIPAPPASSVTDDPRPTAAPTTFRHRRSTTNRTTAELRHRDPRATTTRQRSVTDDPRASARKRRHVAAVGASAPLSSVRRTVAHPPSRLGP